MKRTVAAIVMEATTTAASEEMGAEPPLLGPISEKHGECTISNLQPRSGHSLGSKDPKFDDASRTRGGAIRSSDRVDSNETLSGSLKRRRLSLNNKGIGRSTSVASGIPQRSGLQLRRQVPFLHQSPTVPLAPEPAPAPAQVTKPGYWVSGHGPELVAYGATIETEATKTWS